MSSFESERLLRRSVDVISQKVHKQSFDGGAPALANSELTESILKGQKDEEEAVQHDEHYKENSAGLTIFLLVNTMIGSGILNQPYVFSQAGWLGGFFGYIIAGLLTWLGLNLLTVAGLQEKVYEYGGLVRHALGKPGEVLVDLSIVIGCFGALLGYILVVGSTLSELFMTWGCESDFCGIYSVTAISVAVFVAPICLLRHFGHLAILSVFSIFAIVCVLLLVIIGGPIISDVHGAMKTISGTGMYRSLGSIVFSLSCASANFQGFVSTERKSQNKKSWLWITFWVVIIGSIMCMSMGIAGYGSFLGDTDGIILDNFKGHAYDFFKLMVAAHLIVYIPVNFIIMRYSIVKLTLQKKSEDLSWPVHHSLSMVILGFTTLFTLMFYYLGFASGAAFSLVLNITGGVAGSITSFILPSLVYLTLCPRDKMYYWAILVLVCGIALAVSVIVDTIVAFS